MIVRFAIQQLSTPATCIARNACTGVLYCAHGKSDDHVFRISAECLTLVRSLLVEVNGFCMDVISDVIRMWISDVKIYAQILHGCDPGCDFRLQIFLRCDSACDFWHAWRESALRAPKIWHEFYIYDTNHFQILHGCDSRCEKSNHFCMDVNQMWSCKSDPDSAWMWIWMLTSRSPPYMQPCTPRVHAYAWWAQTILPNKSHIYQITNYD